jgi:hypothetical protein
MVAMDSRGRTILTHDQAKLVALFLANIRGTLQNDGVVSLQDWTDTRQVLSALAISGWAVVPQGLLDGWTKILATEFEVVNGSYMEGKEPEAGKT